VFGYFSSRAAPVYFPGAAFLTAAGLTAGCATLFMRALRLAPQSALGRSTSVAPEV
jgi:hypothetical protein